jgi:hypothetical protein
LPSPALPHRIDNLPHELSRVLENHCIWNAQQPYAKSAQMVFFRGVPAHLIDLRMNAAVEFDGQSMFEAIKIQDSAFQGELAAKFRAQAAATEQVPGSFLRFRRAPA